MTAAEDRATQALVNLRELRWANHDAKNLRYYEATVIGASASTLRALAKKGLVTAMHLPSSYRGVETLGYKLTPEGVRAAQRIKTNKTETT